MNALKSFTFKVSSLLKTAKVKLGLFISVQFLALAVIILHFHYLNTHNISLLEMKLQHQNTVMRENILRAFDVVDAYLDSSLLAYDRAKFELSFNTTRGHDFLRGFITPSVPLLLSVSIYDEIGNIKGSSLQYPAKPINVSDRPYFTAAQSGQSVIYFGPYTSRLNNNTWSYSTVRRIERRDGSFEGVLVGTLALKIFTDFCKDVILSDGIDTYILNKEGVVLAQCGYNSTSTEKSGKLFAAIQDFEGFKDIKTDGLSKRYLLPKWLMYTSKIPNHSEMQIVTVAPKYLLSSSLESFIWQNYLYVVILMLAELVCFLMYRNSVYEAFAD